ncbi:glycosyltransferase [Pseudaquidulcibacter saccharophilus]|uniref:glycosyltransferase n=1 Tax=Pseudaquidulcibacter saccharophilus TaxID=2831900 RepID=UPI001EFF1716|nr:glycosyltransferase [Pseudaquidulcibacter saccharophilus]
MDNPSAKFDISLVLNVHREHLYIHRTLQSICEAVNFAKECNGITFELVVVLDNPNEQIISWSNNEQFGCFDSVEIITVSNGSLGLSRNSGIKITTGKYVCTCDADDLISFNMFSEFYLTAENHDKDCVVYPEFLYSFGDDYHLYKILDYTKVPSSTLVDYHPYISRIFVKGEYARANKYKDMNHKKGFAYEDWWYSMEMKHKELDFIVSKNTVLYYRQRAGSLLKEANSDSKRITDYSDFLHPYNYRKVGKKDEMLIKKSFSRRPTADDIKDEYFNNDVIKICTLAANKIDPSIDFAKWRMSNAFSNLYHYAKNSLFYLDASEFISSHSYSDIVILPYITTGGGEKYILNILNKLKELEIGDNFLFLCGEKFDTHLWQEKLPIGSDLIDLYKITNGDAESIDLITLRLIQACGPQARIHLKTSEFAHRIIRKWGSLLENNKKIYYRFSDPINTSDGEMWLNGYVFNTISENFDNIDLFISDHKEIINSDAKKLGFNSSKYVTIYNNCFIPKEQETKVKPDDYFRLLWASRVSHEKRPELLLAIQNEINKLNLKIKIDAFGKFDPEYSNNIFDNLVAAEYKGEYSDFYELDYSKYDAFIYTSAYDGLPNVVLEAMSCGMPVIVPDVGGLPETIKNGINGFLLFCTGNNDADAEIYIELLKSIVSGKFNLSKIGKQARQTIIDRHSEKTFSNALQSLFST